MTRRTTLDTLMALLVFAVLLYVAAQPDATRPATSEALRQPVYPGRGIAAPSLVPGVPLRMAVPPSGTPGTNGMRPASSESRVAAVTPARLPDTSTLIAGTSSWYCGNGSPCTRNFPEGGPYAAAGSELRIPGWRGKWVEVCSAGRCTKARLIDWCLCGGARVIDLYRGVFAQIANPSRGVIPVTVEFVNLPRLRLPATDTTTGGAP